MSDSEMDVILESHFITPSLLRTDDFNSFFENIKQRLLRLIEQDNAYEEVEA